MQTVNKFSGSTAAPNKSTKFDWSNLATGKIHKAVIGDDYASAKGFLVSMSRWANENNITVERYTAPDGSTVEFRLTPQVPAESVAETTSV